MNYYFITGTSRGIGAALVDLLCSDKSNIVYGFSRTQTANRNNYFHTQLDLSNRDAVEKFAFPEISNENQIVLINNAGILGEIVPIGKQNAENLSKLFTVNSIAPLLLMNSFVRAYQKKKSKRLILNISSGAGRHPIVSWSAYCASKAALDMTGEVLKEEQKLLPFENRINILSVAPGIVDTEMQNQIRQSHVEDFPELERFVTYKQKNQLWTPQQVAQIIVDMITNHSSITVTCVDVRTYKNLKQ